jgi:hypothetical protein
MLIPSIDLMGGKIVQLVQGERKALEFDDFEPWLERFAKYRWIIDLDAVMGRETTARCVPLSPAPRQWAAESRRRRELKKCQMRARCA